MSVRSSSSLSHASRQGELELRVARRSHSALDGLPKPARAVLLLGTVIVSALVIEGTIYLLLVAAFTAGLLLTSSA